MTVLSKLSLTAKTNILFVVTTLVVAFVHAFLQHGSYGWGTIESFLTSWFIHFVGVSLFLVFCGAFVSIWAQKILGNGLTRQELSMGELMVYVMLVVMAGAIALFILGHFPPLDIYDE